MHKKSLFFILAILVFSRSVFAQGNQDTARNYKSYYFTKSGYVTELPDSAYFTRFITPDPSNSKLYILEDTYANGKTRLKGKSLTPGPYFKGQGDFTKYYPNENLQETASYDNGKLTGRYAFNYEDGKVGVTANYADGKLTGERTTYYPNGNKQFAGTYDSGVLLNSSRFFPGGKLYYTATSDTAKKLDIIGEAYDLGGAQTAKNGNGTWIDYADTFKRVFAKGPIISGLKDGEWKGKLKDTLNTFVCIYSKGMLVSGTTYQASTGKEIHFTKEEVEPTFKGGLPRFYKELAANTKYPKKAKEYNVQGKVFLTFVIDRDGSMIDIKVVRGIGSGCDEAAVEALKKTSEPWIPGTQYGLPVRVQYSIPLSFTLKGG